MLFNQSVNYFPEASPLDDTFAALADPTRRSILTRLADSDLTVNQLALPYDMSLPAISKHLKILEQAGLISKRKDAQKRICTLEAAKMREATEWLGAYESFWKPSLAGDEPL